MAKAYVEKYEGIFNGNIASTSTGTGTLVVTGGIGTTGRVSANDVAISATTSSTSTTTGALKVSGGVGVVGNVHVGGSTASTSTGSGTLVVTGGVGVSGNIYATNGYIETFSLFARGRGIGGYFYNSVWQGPDSIVTTPSVQIGSIGSIGGYNSGELTNATSASTSTDTGTLVVNGGVGISGCLNIGGYITKTVLSEESGGNGFGGYMIGNDSFGVGQSSTSTSTGTLVVTGGVGVSGNVNSGGSTNNFTGNTASTSTGTGTLVVTGGVGVSGNLNVGGAFNVGALNSTDLTVSGNVNSGGSTNNFTGNTASTSTGTGTLVVTGGVGISGNLNVGGAFNVGALNSTDLTVSGNLIVNGTTTTINSSTLTVDDKNIELGSLGYVSTQGDITNGSNLITNINTTGIVAGMSFEAVGDLGGCNGFDGIVSSVSSNTVTMDVNSVCSNVGVAFVFGAADVTANGGGITLKGTTDKTIIWDNTNNNWTSSEHWNLPTGKVFKINNTNVLSSNTLGSAITFNSNTASTSTDTGTLVVTGGVGVSGRVTANNIDIKATTASTTTGTGALLVTGGVGIGGNVYVGGNIIGSSGITGQSLTINYRGINIMSGDPSFKTGIMTFSGNGTGTGGYQGSTQSYFKLSDPDSVVGAHDNIIMNAISGQVNFNPATPINSTSTGTGTLVVTGGVGISGTVSASSLNVPSINSTPIGNATASSGAFTTLSSSSATTMTAGTASTSTGTGTLVVTGGVGVSGVIHCKGIKTNKLNPGVTLIYGATPSPKISIKFPVNFKLASERSMFQVPVNHIFLIDSMEVITTSISDAGTPPTVRLGNTSVANAYYGPTQVTSNSVGARHIIENPQDGVAAGTTVTCGVTVASTATSHNGFIKVSGELIDTSEVDVFLGEAGEAYQDS